MTAQRTVVDVAGIERPDGHVDFATALLPYRGELNARLAAHLLRRAGFGGTPQEVARYAAMSPGDAVESLVRFADTSALPSPGDVYDPATLLGQYGPRGLRDLSSNARRALYEEVRRNEVRSVVSLQEWWLQRMLATPAPLQEKMAFFFHGHFTTAAIQKGVSPVMVYNQNQLFRSYALGNLRELTRAISKDPAMLLYLDNALNVATHPNENYARELMELFTLGVDQYTEDDVRESARAWTGWRVQRLTDRVFFQPRLHDDGSKTFLGNTGNWTGDDIVNIIFSQAQCARFFGKALLAEFVYDDPEPALVDEAANLLLRHDYELAPVVSALLRSNVFYSERAYRARVKTPVELVVGTYKSLGVANIDRAALGALHAMGQILFYPPNVAGWPGGENWLTSQMMIARQNFLAGLVNAEVMGASSWLNEVPMDPAAATHALVSAILEDDASPSSYAQLKSFLGGAGTSALAMLGVENFPVRIHGAAYLTMAMPAYQLA
ncbi:MAG: DUF1800 domain-containing protein [Candidatus Tyrphobacter sp.]